MNSFNKIQNGVVSYCIGLDTVLNPRRSGYVEGRSEEYQSIFSTAKSLVHKNFDLINQSVIQQFPYDVHGMLSFRELLNEHLVLDLESKYVSSRVRGVNPLVAGDLISGCVDERDLFGKHFPSVDISRFELPELVLD